MVSRNIITNQYSRLGLYHTEKRYERYIQEYLFNSPKPMAIKFQIKKKVLEENLFFIWPRHSLFYVKSFYGGTILNNCIICAMDFVPLLRQLYNHL